MKTPISLVLLAFVCISHRCEAAQLDELTNQSIRTKLFSIDDFGDLTRFAEKVRTGSDPVSQLLVDNLSKTTFERLRQGGGQASVASAKQELAEALNRILLRGTVYSKEKFREVNLPENIRLLTEMTPNDSLRVSLNRMLIEKAYPTEIVRKLELLVDGSSKRFLVMDSAKKTISFYDGAGNELWWADVGGTAQAATITGKREIRHVDFGPDKLILTVGKHDTFFADAKSGKLTYFGAD